MMPTRYQMLGSEGFGTYEADSTFTVFERVSAPAPTLLVPGFVDLHIHGAYGIDFMSSSEDQILALARRLAKDGYEAFLPTTVTTDAATALDRLNALPEDPMIAGLHLEGPFISPSFPGAQPPHLIEPVPVGPSAWDAVFDHPKLALITLAPELPGALELINRLTNRGVIVSLGHTNATYEEARRGFEFGARHATHTFNAMRPFHHREAGAVGYVLSQDSVTAELIYDRLHVCPDSARFLLRTKPDAKVIAVSDGTLAGGLPAGTRLSMWGLEVEVGRQEVRLLDGTLAGSGITLVDAFRNLLEDFGAETAIRLCCLNPRLALGRTAHPRVWVEFSPRGELLAVHD